MEEKEKTNLEKKRAKEEKKEARKQKALKGKPPECPNLVCVPFNAIPIFPFSLSPYVFLK